MNDVLILICVAAMGVLLGILFFGGLWLTVVNGLNSKNPALWFMLSFILRIVAVLLGFYYVSQGHWQRFVACLLGFIIARIIITRLPEKVKHKRNEI